MDKICPTYGVQTQSRVTASDFHSRIPPIPIDLSLTGENLTQSPLGYITNAEFHHSIHPFT